jgi:hypothetical protein
MQLKQNKYCILVALINFGGASRIFHEISIPAFFLPVGSLPCGDGHHPLPDKR